MRRLFVHVIAAGLLAAVGLVSKAAPVAAQKDKQTMELENYDIEPIRLTEVSIEK